MATKRQKTWNKSNGHCWYCGDQLGKGWHVDHFLPLKRNQDGTVTHPERDTFENSVPACASCNIMKSSMDIETFRWLIGNFIKRLNRDVAVYRHAKRYGLVEETENEVVFWFERSKNIESPRRKQQKI